MSMNTMPNKGDRFHHSNFCRGATLTVVRSQPLGGRHGTGYVTFSVAADDGHPVTRPTRWWSWPTWKADVNAGELVPIDHCPSCSSIRQITGPMECLHCGGKGWIPARLTD